MLTRAECRAVVDRIVELSSADEVRVSLRDERTTHLRFARNTPSTSGNVRSHTVSVTSVVGTRSGTASVNQLDDGSLRRAVRRSEEIAGLAPPDPEFVEGLGPQDYQRVEAWSNTTARNAPEHIAAGSELAIRDAREAGLVAAGFSRSDARVECLGSSTGLFGYHRSTTAAFTETVRTTDGTGSGWANDASNDVSELDYVGRSGIAIDKGRRSAKPRELPPGEYPAILEPACVASMVGLLLGAMDRRGADEGRSYFGTSDGTRLGEELFPRTVTIASDPASSLAPVRPWASDGLPRRRVGWIVDGTVGALATSRYWARTAGVEPVAGSSNVLMKGGAGSLESLVRSTERGLLVTSLWYIRSVDPRSLSYTGLTRDGVFWIENGEIAYPVNNFRWNDSPVRVLKNVEAMSRAVRVAGRGSRGTSSVVPALRVSGFEFSSVSEAV